MTPRQEAIEFITDGYESIGQMSIRLADKLGYMRDTKFILIDPQGDASSAGMPFIMDPVKTATGMYRYSTYDLQGFNVVQAEYQVLVYREAPPPPLSPHAQIDLLEQFAQQFDEDSLIRQLLSDELIEWLYQNPDTPDIYREMLRMKTAAYRIEGHMDDLEELF